MTEIVEDTYGRNLMEEGLHEAGLRQQEALDQIDIVDKEIKEMEVPCNSLQFANYII